uniref:Trehalase n=3 Tax=Rhodnius prolixus TaxID=13249 RepID=T1I3H0_RHOPR
MSEVFADQETFFEKKLKYPVIDVLDNFYNLKKEFGGTLPSTEAMKSFIEDNFEDVSATEHWIPQDWTEEPEIFDRVRDKNLKKWALQLNQMWKTLGRKVSQIVVDNPDLFATYCLPNG